MAAPLKTPRGAELVRANAFAAARRRGETLEECTRIADDVVFNELKNSGALQRRESDRALAHQINEGPRHV